MHKKESAYEYSGDGSDELGQDVDAKDLDVKEGILRGDVR